jgi:hypothetical protein
LNRDDIIRMARQAQLICDTRPTTCWKEGHDLTPQIERFAALVAAAEREACAQMVEHIFKKGGGTYGDAIRARSNN